MHFALTGDAPRAAPDLRPTGGLMTRKEKAATPAPAPPASFDTTESAMALTAKEMNAGS
jgi:hypothetical protein